MLSANFETQFFRQPFADFWWKAIMHVTGSHQGRIDHGHGGRCRHRYYQPHECRKSETCERPQFQPKGMTRLKVANDSESKEEDCSRDRGQRYESHVDTAVQALTGLAKFTNLKVMLVVAAHFWRQARNVIAPTGENLSYNRIHTLIHSGYSWIGCSGSD